MIHVQFGGYRLDQVRSPDRDDPKAAPQDLQFLDGPQEIIPAEQRDMYQAVRREPPPSRTPRSAMRDTRRAEATSKSSSSELAAVSGNQQLKKRSQRNLELVCVSVPPSEVQTCARDALVAPELQVLNLQDSAPISGELCP